MSEEEGDIAQEFIRTRIGLRYKIKTVKLNVRLFAEHFNQPNNSKLEHTETRTRYTLKLSRKFKNRCLYSFLWNTRKQFESSKKQ